MSAAAAPVRVAVLNDYDIVVSGVARMLEPHGDRVRVVETSTGVPERGVADVVLYDTFSQSQGNVLEVQEVATQSGAAVVLFSWNLDATLVAEALRRGAAGYLSKTLDGEGLADALVRVAGGERVLPDDRGGREHGAWPGQEHGLSAREAEMMALITQGFSNAEIAARSYLSVNSVKTYIRTAYRKLGLNRRSQAVRWGLEHGFLPPEPRRTETGHGSKEVAAPRP
jgi:DNA-binding NarL/FixJ family response regulator